MRFANHQMSENAALKGRDRLDTAAVLLCGEQLAKFSGKVSLLTRGPRLCELAVGTPNPGWDGIGTRPARHQGCRPGAPSAGALESSGRGCALDAEPRIEAQGSRHPKPPAWLIPRDKRGRSDEALIVRPP